MVSLRFFLERFRELIQFTICTIEKILKLLNCVDHDNENEKSYECNQKHSLSYRQFKLKNSQNSFSQSMITFNSCLVNV
jgi:hypothetical protein